MRVICFEEVMSDDNTIFQLHEKDEESSRKDEFLYQTMPAKIINTIRCGEVPLHETIKVSLKRERRSEESLIVRDKVGILIHQC